MWKCPKCASEIEDNDAIDCWNCDYSKGVPSNAKATQEPEKVDTGKNTKVKDPIKEFYVFGIGLGILLGIVGILCITQVDSNAPRISGMPRGIAFGVPLMLISIAMIWGGILVKKKDKYGVDLIVMAGFFLLMADLAVEIGVLGRILAFGLLSILMYSLPFIIWSKSKNAKVAIDDLNKKNNDPE